MTEETIRIEEEDVVYAAEENKSDWVEEMTVAAGDLVSTLVKLAKDSTVSQIILTKKNGEKFLEIPVLVGVAGFAILFPYSILAALVMFVAEMKITVVRRGTQPATTTTEEADLVDEVKILSEEATPVYEQCQGTTKSGSQCKRKPIAGTAFCAQH